MPGQREMPGQTPATDPLGPFASAIAGGDLRAQLVALRDYLADALENCLSSRDQAPLAAQLREVLVQLDALPLTGEASTVDELARQRAARRAAPAAS